MICHACGDDLSRMVEITIPSTGSRRMERNMGYAKHDDEFVAICRRCYGDVRNLPREEKHTRVMEIVREKRFGLE